MTISKRTLRAVLVGIGVTLAGVADHGLLVILGAAIVLFCFVLTDEIAKEDD